MSYKYIIWRNYASNWAVNPLTPQALTIEYLGLLCQWHGCFLLRQVSDPTVLNIKIDGSCEIIPHIKGKYCWPVLGNDDFAAQFASNKVMSLRLFKVIIQSEFTLFSLCKTNWNPYLWYKVYSCFGIVQKYDAGRALLLWRKWTESVRKYTKSSSTY